MHHLVDRCPGRSAAVEFAMIMAPPTPCTTRKPISQSAPAAPPIGVSASAMDATVKTAKPAL
jgi:hypothetical protein